MFLYYVVEHTLLSNNLTVLSEERGFWSYIIRWEDELDDWGVLLIDEIVFWDLTRTWIISDDG